MVGGRNRFSLLPKAFADESFAFYGTALAGTPTERERWKRAVDATSDAMGQAVGKLYVGKYFPEASKQKVTALVKNIMLAFDKRINSLAWMAPATQSLTSKVGDLPAATLGSSKAVLAAADDEDDDGD